MLNEKLKKQIDVEAGTMDFSTCLHEEFEKISKARTFHDEYYCIRCKECGLTFWAKKLEAKEFNKEFLNARFGMQFESDLQYCVSREEIGIKSDAAEMNVKARTAKITVPCVDHDQKEIFYPHDQVTGKITTKHGWPEPDPTDD